MELKKQQAAVEADSAEEPKKESDSGEVEVAEVLKKKAHFKGMRSVLPSRELTNDKSPEFLTYFSEWRHAKMLIGTCMCWFLLDIAFVLSMG